jgi:hypothetical protein
MKNSRNEIRIPFQNKALNPQIRRGYLILKQKTLTGHEISGNRGV